VDYSYAQIPLAGGFKDWIACVPVAAAAVAAGLLYRRKKVAFFAAGFAFVCLFPMSNLAFPIGTIMAERFLYLPAFGFAVCLTLAIYYVGGLMVMHPGVPVKIGMVIIAGLMARTWFRNADWRSELTIWASAAKNAPLSFKTHTSYAKALLGTADPDGDQVYHEDMEGLRVLDTLPDQSNNAGIYFDIAGQFVLIGDSLHHVFTDGTTETPEDAIEKYNNAQTMMLRGFTILKAQHKEPDAYSYLMLSQIEYRLGKASEALRDAVAAREAQPMVPAPYLRIHDILLSGGHREEAMASLMTGVFLTSDHALQAKLVDDYAADPNESLCATAGISGSIDSTCQIVRRQACSIAPDVLRLGLKAGGPATEARLKSELSDKYGCELK
jgi:hypothetical protein